MIRIVYWSLALIEVLLILLVLVLFVVTDARSIKYIAQTSLESSKLQYESIEGNLFEGLDISKLSYDNKPLFSSARIHWNPITLLYNKLTITQLDAQGIELDNLLYMVQDLGSNASSSKSDLKFSLALNSSHFDINPYVYEGVKFSSFVLETGKIEVDETLTINTDALYLKFDSDLVNSELNGSIEEGVLNIDDLALKNISINDISKFTRNIKATAKKSKTKNNQNATAMLIKSIKAKHIVGTLKPVQYGDLKIKRAELNLDDAVIDPTNNFEYQVNKLVFSGKTNFGLLNYKGKIKDSTIQAKGNIYLDKFLFTKYHLPLNFKGLKTLPSTLRLNHNAVWIDIEHPVKELLVLKSDFNLDANKAKHKLHYDYAQKELRIDSDMSGKMTYAEVFELENEVLIKDGKFSYEGKVNLSKTKNLPTFVSEYLLTELKGDFAGDSKNFEMELENSLLKGHFSMPNYAKGILDLKSKERNIALRQLIANLPLELEKKKMALNAQSTFNFSNLKKSNINVKAQTETLFLDAKMNLEKPYKVYVSTELISDRTLKKIAPLVNFSQIKNLEGSVVFQENYYDINFKNNNLEIALEYDTVNSMLQKGLLQIANETFKLDSNADKSLELSTKIANIQNFLEHFKAYYQMKLPNLQGSMSLDLKQTVDGTLEVQIDSPNIKYLSDAGVNLSVTNLYNIDLGFKIDQSSNIVLDHYEFKIDENDYLSHFYATKNSYLRLNKNILEIQKLWFNNKAVISGKYNLESLEGKLKVDSKRYTYRTKDFDLLFNTNLGVKLNKEKIDVEGDIEILGNLISYEVVGSGIVEDADIVIMKDMLAKRESALKNLKLYIKVKNTKPLQYRGENVEIKFLNDISILKGFNQDMVVTGMTTITSGFYQLEDKRFNLDKSQLYFTGDAKKPLLDIKASYVKDEYNIHVFISGTTDSPIVNFNAEPYLTQQEIMSLILFDGTGSSSGNGAEAYTILGGTFAKGLIKSLGIDVDHLLLGKDAQEELSLEVGKKVLDNVSVLYLHKDGLDGVKVRIEHSNSFETDIIIQPPNTSSIEFLYKQDR